MPVARLNLTAQPFQDGRPFGETGPYEELTGQAEFAVRPDHPLNQVIVDLPLAPRDAQGNVRFTADVRILRPVDARRSNRGLFLEVPNRGGSIVPRMFEPGPMGPSTGITEGFLLRRGFTVATCGWQHDIPRGGDRFGVTAPEAMLDGKRLTGEVSTMRTIDAPTDRLMFDSTYAPVDAATGSLLERDEPAGQGREIARDRWRFVEGKPEIVYADGFVAGKTYVVAYTAVGAPVTGVGLLALRDLASHVRQTDALQFAIAFGASQTGRLLRQFVHLGLCEDEDGRLVVDGILAVAAGARTADANRRFGQPSSQDPTPPCFPFTDALQTDPSTRQVDGLLRRALERGKVPRIIHLNTSSEYCSSSAYVHASAAMSHLTADGRADVEVPDNVRIYLCCSTQHAPDPLPLTMSGGLNASNTIDYKPFVRAAADNLTLWITGELDPPPSRYPRLDDGTLEADLRSTTDADGNEVAGVRHPDVSVPLGTYTGWNPRHPSTGGAHLLMRARGSTLPFSADAIHARYSSRDDFLIQIRTAAETLASERYILQDDVAGVIRASGERWDEFVTLNQQLDRHVGKG
jgi:Alpha/beta hydrolase domain